MDNVLQLLTLIIIFIVVLFATTWVTRWVAGYQKARLRQENLEVIETLSLSQSKYIQIIRVGSVYMAVGVCKDTMTMLGIIEKDALHFSEKEEASFENFQDILKKVKDRKKLGD